MTMNNLTLSIDTFFFILFPLLFLIFLRPAFYIILMPFSRAQHPHLHSPLLKLVGVHHRSWKSGEKKNQVSLFIKVVYLWPELESKLLSVNWDGLFFLLFFLKPQGVVFVIKAKYAHHTPLQVGQETSHDIRPFNIFLLPTLYLLLYSQSLSHTPGVTLWLKVVI